MSNLLESLESRMFLSASPLVTTLHTDESAAKTDLSTLVKAGTTIEKTLKVDLASAPKSTAMPQEKALMTALSTLEKADSKALAVATSKVNSDVNKLDAAVAALAKKPGNAALTNKVTTDQTALSTDASTDLAAIKTADNGDAVLAALGNITADGGTAGTAATNATTTLSTDDSAYSAAATLAFSTDVSAIITAS